MSTPGNFVFSARSVTLALGTVAVALCLAYGGVVVMRLQFHHPGCFGMSRLFDLDKEANVPALFSTLLFFANAVWLFLIARFAKPEGTRASTWYGLSLLFVLLGLDESVSIHELFSAITRGQVHTSGLLYFAWIIPYGAGVLFLSAVLLRWFLRLERTTQRRFVLAAALFVGGALGVEMLGGQHWEQTHGVDDWTYDSLVALEESMEMAGLITFGYALLSILENSRLGFGIRFQPSEKVSAAHPAATVSPDKPYAPV